MMKEKKLDKIQYYETVGQVFLGLPGSSPLNLLKQLGVSFDGKNEDEFFCLHYEIFGRQGLPYHSVFWSSDEEKNFFRSHLLSFFEREDDFKKRPEFKKESPDHIGLHFLFLSYLLKKELEGKNVKISRKLQHFVDSYLFPFCTAFLSTLEKESRPLFKDLGQKLFKEILIDFKSNEKKGKSYTEKFSEKNDLENWSPVTILENKDLGLKDVATYLLNPSNAGFFLGQQNLLDCAKSCGLPSGFGKRADILLQLFYTSLDFEKWELLIEALKGEVEKWIYFYENKKENLKSHCTYWDSLINRSKKTRDLLTKMKAISEKLNINISTHTNLSEKSYNS